MIDVYINAPFLGELLEPSQIDQTRRRIEVYLNRVEQRKNEFDFSDVRLKNISSKKIQNPKSIHKMLSSNKSDFIFFFYIGEAIKTDHTIHLIQNQTKPNDLNSMLDIEELTKYENIYVFCDIIDKTKSNKLSILKNSFSSHQNCVFSDFTRSKGKTYFDEFIALNEIIPKYTVSSAHDFIVRNTPSLWVNKRTTNLEIRSFNRNFPVWEEDQDNFGSENEGSREDGIQTLRFLQNKHIFAKESRYLLEYFSNADPAKNVRDAARRTLEGSNFLAFNQPRFKKSNLANLQRLVGDFCEIEAGTFHMGSNPKMDPKCLPEEMPVHNVFLDQFEIQKAPVSVALYRAFHTEVGKRDILEKPITREKRTPITNVSWYEAIEFCIWLNVKMRNEGLLGRNEEMRMPTEAEWEKSAKGQDELIYPWGNTFRKNRCHYRDDEIGNVIESGSYSPEGDSQFGMQDMAGNSWDWTLTNWGEGGAKPDFDYPYVQDDGREDIFAGPHIRRVVRGGAYYYWDHCLRTTTRNIMYPETKHTGGGIRLVKSKSIFFN